jgi:hypothetical protein
MLLNLAAQLAPAYLRIGGTLADRLIFEPDANYSPVRLKSNMSDGGMCSYEGKGCAHQNLNFFNMTGVCRLGHFCLSRDEVLAAVLLNIQFFCNVTLCVTGCVLANALKDC